MNSKKANWAFLITIVCYIGVSFAAALLFPSLGESLFWSNLLIETVITGPILVLALAFGERPVSFLGFHRIKLSTALMTVLFTFLSIPLLSLLNLITQIWVKNEVVAAMESMDAGSMPLWTLYLSVGIIAPLFEEVACRGAYYHSYRKSGSVFGAMVLSALVFALFHMNFNQAAYAFAMGIMAVLLVEATGSLWSSVLYHGVINGSQVVLLHGALKMQPSIYGGQSAVITPNILLYGIAGYLFLTAVTLPLAWAVLVWIGTNEGKREALSNVFRRRAKEPLDPMGDPSEKKKDKMVTVPFVLALILCLGMMTGLFLELALKIVQAAP